MAAHTPRWIKRINTELSPVREYETRTLTNMVAERSSTPPDLINEQGSNPQDDSLKQQVENMEQKLGDMVKHVEELERALNEHVGRNVFTNVKVNRLAQQVNTLTAGGSTRMEMERQPLKPTEKTSCATINVNPLLINQTGLMGVLD